METDYGLYCSSQPVYFKNRLVYCTFTRYQSTQFAAASYFMQKGIKSASQEVIS